MSSPFWFEVFKATTPPGVLMQALRDGLVPDPNQVRNGVTLLTSYLRSHHGYCNPWHQPIRDAGDPHQWESVPIERATSTHVAAALLAAGADPYALSVPASGMGVDALGPAVSFGMSDFIGYALANNPPPPQAVERWNQASSHVCMPSESIPLPWMHAWANAGQPSMLSALVDMGLAPNGRDAKERTPLFFVSTAEEVQVLVQAGAQRAPLDKAGRAPERLWINKDPEHIQNVSGLLEHSSQEADKVLQAAAIARMNAYALRFRHVSWKDFYSPTNTLLSDWLAMLEVSQAPVHTWRLPVLKGQMKGEWSLMSTLSLATLFRSEGAGALGWDSLLSRSDMLTPDNHAGRKGWSEKGLLALALWLKVDDAFYAGRQYGGVTVKDKPTADYLAYTKRSLEVFTKLGDPAWVLSPTWLDAACEATVALRKIKASTVATNLVTAWDHWAKSLHVAKVGCVSDFGKHPGHALLREVSVPDALSAFERVRRAGVPLPTSAAALLIKMAPQVTPEHAFVWAACMAWASQDAWLENGSPNGAAGSAPKPKEFSEAMVQVLEKGVVLPANFRIDNDLWREWETLVPGHAQALRALLLDQALAPATHAPPRVRM